MAAVMKPMPGTHAKAITLIGTFNSTAPATSPHYPRLLKLQIVKELTDSVNMKAQILRQRNTNMCGPAAFFFSILQIRPDLYVQTVSDLYIKGNTKLGKLTLSSSTKAKSYLPAKIRHIGWMTFTSIKPGYGTPLDTLEPLNGLTLSGDLKKWLQDAGFLNVNDQTKYSALLPSVAIEKLHEAQTAYDTSHSVFLLVDAEIFTPFRYKKGLSGLPNHWVLLNSNIQIQKYNSKTKSYLPPTIITPVATKILITEAKIKKEKEEDDADMYEADEEAIAMKDKVIFEAFTWGNKNAIVQSRISTTHTAELGYFIQGYYGYIKGKF